jgi:hypothetical protein
MYAMPYLLKFNNLIVSCCLTRIYVFGREDAREIEEHSLLVLPGKFSTDDELLLANAAWSIDWSGILFFFSYRQG